MVSALACRIRGREFESPVKHFPQNQIIFFYYLVFPFYFSQFWSKTMCKYILKVWQYWICNGKEAKLFIFFKMTNTPHKGKTRHIAWLSSFLRHNAFIEMKMTLHLMTNTIWEGKWLLCGLATFWKNDNSSCFYIPIVSTESQVLYSFIIKVRMDTPIFYFLIFFW